MDYWLTMPLSFIGGVAIGLFYFWGLWLTVTRAPNAKSPLIFYGLSLCIRLAVLLTTMLLVFQLGVAELCASLVGFAIARFILIRLVGFSVHQEISQKAITD